MKAIKILMMLVIASLNINCSAMTGRNTPKITRNIGNVISHSKRKNIVPQNYNHLITSYSTQTRNNYSKLAAGVIVASLLTTVAYADEQNKDKALSRLKNIPLKNGNQLYIKEISSTCYLVSVISTNGEEIAIANFIIAQNNKDEQIAHLGLIEVHPKYRKKNIGSEIVRTIIDFAIAQNCRSISLFSVHNTREFYEKLGFIVTVFFDHSACSMEKNLSKN